MSASLCPCPCLQHTLQLTCILASDEPRVDFSKFSRKGHIANLVRVKFVRLLIERLSKEGFVHTAGIWKSKD